MKRIFPVLVALICAGSAHAQPHYTVTLVPTSIYNVEAINIFGEVTGETRDPSNPPIGKYLPPSGVAAVCLNGKVTYLTTPATGFPNVSFGEAINDFGEVVGEYRDPGVTGGFFAFLYKPGQPLQILEGTQAIDPTFAINNLGHIALSLPVTSPYSVQNAAIYRNGVVTYLGNLNSGNSSEANGINDRDQVVGRAVVQVNGIYHAFLWQDGRMTDLGTLDGPTGNSGAAAINDLGQIVGYSTDSSLPLLEGQVVIVPVLWQNGVMYNLGLLPAAPGASGPGAAQFGNATAINNLGEIIGYSYSFSYQNGQTASCFLYVGGKMYDLNSLLPPNSGYTIMDVLGINDLGVILALTSAYQTVLLTPLPWFQGLAVKH